MIDNSIFTSQIQMALYQMLSKLLEKYSGGAGAVEFNPPGQAANAAPNAPAANAGTGKEGKFEDLIQAASAKYEVDPNLIRAVIRAESNFRPNAESSAGAIGLMQLMPGTARGLGVDDPFDPAQNINGGVKLLHRLLRKYDNRIPLALAAYNAGMGAVEKYGGVPPYKETQTYIKRILGYLKREYERNG
jgi:soluble lytic murein transglycosylase-like protein